MGRCIPCVSMEMVTASFQFFPQEGGFKIHIWGQSALLSAPRGLRLYRGEEDIRVAV